MGQYFVSKRLDHDFFNMLTLMLAENDSFEKQGRETPKRVLSSNSMDLREFLSFRKLAGVPFVS